MTVDVHHIDLMHLGIPGAIGAWVVKGPTGWVVIESGPASCWETLHTGLQALGVTIDQIAALLLTHIHLDHAGGAPPPLGGSVARDPCRARRKTARRDSRHL